MDKDEAVMQAARWLATASAEERSSAPPSELLAHRFNMTAEEAERAAREARLIRARAH